MQSQIRGCGDRAVRFSTLTCPVVQYTDVLNGPICGVAHSTHTCIHSLYPDSWGFGPDQFSWLGPNFLKDRRDVAWQQNKYVHIRKLS